MEILGKLITLVTTLFTLSLVSERVINWMKLYFGQAGKKLPFFTHREEDISKQSTDPKFNAMRERKILGLNITVGILIAFLAHANLFEILRSENPAEMLGWNTMVWPDGLSNQIWLIFANLIGCALSGLCMSMGSKFWHDTLDLLFYTKNLRQKMVDKETYKQQSMKQLDQWIDISWSEIVKKVFDANHKLLCELPNVNGCGIIMDASGKELIELMISSNSDDFPKTLEYLFPDGTKAYVPVEIIITPPVIAQSLQKQIAANKDNPTNQGTIGLIVRKRDDPEKRPLYLSCYHVLKTFGHHYPDFSPVQSEEIIDPTNGNSILGTLVEGLRNDRIDAALCSVENNPNKMELIGFNGICPLKTAREFRKLTVRFFGAASGEVSCLVRSLDYSPNILYNIGPDKQEFHRLHNLIAISDNCGISPSKPGDSGAILTDEQKRIIGMLVAGGGHRSFVIPISSILDTLNLEIHS